MTQRKVESKYNLVKSKKFLCLLMSVLVSMLGIHLVDFSLGIWVFQQTQSVTLFGLVGFATLAPQILFSPFIGVFVDRCNHKVLILMGNVGAVLCVLTFFSLYYFDNLGVWHVIIISAVSSIFSGILYTTLAASAIHILPGDQIVKNQGIQQGGVALIKIISPFGASIIFSKYGIENIFLVGGACIICAVSLLCIIKLKNTYVESLSSTNSSSIFEELIAGWRYVSNEQGFIPLMGLLAVAYFVIGSISVLLTPLVLSYSDAKTLGLIYSVAGSGLLCGSLYTFYRVSSAKNIFHILVNCLSAGICMLFLALPASTGLLVTVSFIIMFNCAIILSCYQSIFQQKIPANLQGRVFGIRMIISESAFPIGYLLAGPLADNIFEPLMATGGLWSNSLCMITGCGQGRGIAFLCAVMGGVLITFVILASASPKLRLIDKRPINALSITGTGN